jgi:hypothetical protein
MNDGRLVIGGFPLGATLAGVCMSSYAIAVEGGTEDRNQ